VKEAPITKPVIKINDVHYVPVKGKNATTIKKNGVTYISVTPLPSTKVVTNPIFPKANVTVDVLKEGGKTYIPIRLIPKAFHPIFKKVTPVVKIGNSHFVPIVDKKVTTIVVD